MTIDWKLIIMIFVINVTYVTLSTIRLKLTMKGYRILAPLVSMVEITIYITGLGMVLSELDNPLNLFAYALGYAIGISAGIKIEEKLALGYIMVTVILPKENAEIIDIIRNAGYGVTVTCGFGREGERLILEILSSRKNEQTLYDMITITEPTAFVISHEPKYISGGFWTKRIKG